MTTHSLDELIVPAPPYRMARPVASLTAAPSDFKNDALKQQLEGLAVEKAVLSVPEKSAQEIALERADAAVGVRDAALEAEHPDLKTKGEALAAIAMSVREAAMRVRGAAEVQPEPEPIPVPVPVPEVGSQTVYVKPTEKPTGRYEMPAAAQAEVDRILAKQKELRAQGKEEEAQQWDAALSKYRAFGRADKAKFAAEKKKIETAKPKPEVKQKEEPKVLRTLEEERESLIAAKSGMSKEKFQKDLQAYDEAIARRDRAAEAKPAIVEPVPVSEVGSKRVYMKAIQPPVQKQGVPKPTAEVDVLDVLREAHGGEPEQPEQPKKSEDFHITFEGPSRPTREAPKLDSLAAIQQFIEFSRRTGRSQKFIRGLEQLRSEYARKSEQPRPEPGSERVYVRPGTPEGNAVAVARRAAAETVPAAREQSQSETIAQLQKRIAQLESQTVQPKKTEEQSGDEVPASPEEAVHIGEIGEQKGLSFWEHWKTAQVAQAEDLLAGVSAALAKKWEGRLQRRNEKIKKWEESGKTAAKKSMFGMLRSMMWDEQWANYHRWKGRHMYKKQEAWNDSRVRRENVRDEILNEGAAKIDRLLDSQYERIDQYALQRDEADKLLERLYALHKKATEQNMAKARPAQLQMWRDNVDALAQRIRDASMERGELDEKWQAERKRAAKQQARKEGLLSYAVRPARVDTTPKAYKWLMQRVTRPGGSPKARDGKILDKELVA